jgi:aminocarboxymuconate-semialdehyde decarboxylase
MTRSRELKARRRSKALVRIGGGPAVVGEPAVVDSADVSVTLRNSFPGVTTVRLLLRFRSPKRSGAWNGRCWQILGLVSVDGRNERARTWHRTAGRCKDVVGVRSQTGGILDVHAHYFPADLADWAARTGDARWPSLVVADQDGPGTGQIMLGRTTTFRKVRAPLWDLPARFAELDAHGVALQVISPTPILLTYWAESKLALEFARAVNDSLAAQVAASGGRVAGLGSVPLQDGALAADELRRAVGELGLAGVEIGTQACGRELDDPEFVPFFDAAAELDAAIFVHPLDGGGAAIRRSGQPYDFGLGMLTDTAMAATALVCGGVLDDRPELRIGLSHGCGTLAWAAPRLKLGTALSADPGRADTFDELVSRLWVDTLVFDPEYLRLLVHRFGAEHVMVGTDYPFIPGQLEGASTFIGQALERGALTDDQADAILHSNARAFINNRSTR